MQFTHFSRYTGECLVPVTFTFYSYIIIFFNMFAPVMSDYIRMEAGEVM